MVDSNENKEDMKRKYRPFINLWEWRSPEFKELIKKLMVLIRHGVDDNSKNLKIEPIEDFKRLLSGWKQAQQIIADELIVKLTRIQELEKEKKLAHSSKDYETKNQCIRNVKNIKSEIIILRKCIDSIVWMLLNNEHSAIRRLPINGNPDNLSAFNINDSMASANEINADPMAIAIITDITTFVHTGDLLALIPNKGIALIELKSGKKNIEFSKAAKFAVMSECNHFEEEYTKGFDKKDLKHYQRTKRQVERGRNVIEAISTGSGFDNLFQSPVKILDKNFQPDFYTDKIIGLWNKVYNGKSWAITDINECLFIGAYSNANMGFIGFNGWMDGCKISGRIFNILDSFSDPLSRPFFSLNLPDKLLLDIIDGNLIVVLCFDQKLFVDRANKKYPKLYKILNFPPEIIDTTNMLSINGKGIASCVENESSFIGIGYETRIIFDQQYPDNLIDWSYKMSDLKKEYDKKKSTEKNKAQRKLKKARKRSRT